MTYYETLKGRIKIDEVKEIPEEGVPYNDNYGLKIVSVEHMGLPYEEGKEFLKDKTFVRAGTGSEGASQ
jgi:hypothetical protein